MKDIDFEIVIFQLCSEKIFEMGLLNETLGEEVKKSPILIQDIVTVCAYFVNEWKPQNLVLIYNILSLSDKTTLIYSFRCCLLIRGTALCLSALKERGDYTYGSLTEKPRYLWENVDRVHDVLEQAKWAKSFFLTN